MIKGIKESDIKLYENRAKNQREKITYRESMVKPFKQIQYNKERKYIYLPFKTVKM